MAYKKNLQERGVLTAVAFVFLIFATDNGQAWKTEDCPSFCECFMLYELRWASCVGRRLYSIHTGVDKTVQALDLFNNSITSLGDYELRDAGLTRLKLLNISLNSISEIGLAAFSGLSDLRILDLRKNHLYSILPDTFVDNKKLEILQLSGNNLNQHVPKLRSSSVASLGFGNCRISYLPPDTFDLLPRLRILDISDNTIIQLEFDILKSVPKLVFLKLERNPWACNNHMYNLQDRLTSSNVVFDKVCNYNKKLPQKSKAPKKFEKMIALKAPSTTTPSSIESKSSGMLAKIKSWRNSWKLDTTSERCPQSSVVTTTKKKAEKDSFESEMKTISFYWFLAIGFLLGSAVGTVATYVWLTRTISRSLEGLRRRTLRPESSEIADQRLNLLEHLWRNNMDANAPTTECPGTPPPPYRDVMLHASRYPRPNIQAIVFTNDPVTRDERQVHS